MKIVRRRTGSRLKTRHATTIPVLLVIGTLPALADTLPAYCGGVGANGYTPPVVAIPAVVLNRGTVITVTNATVVVNGDTSSVKALMANPGPDGISLEEALRATNNNPGIWNIQFAPALKGSTIAIDPGLSPLTGGNVTINGDIDGSGQPGITLTSAAGNLSISVSSGGNTLNGLALQNCGQGANHACVILRNATTHVGPGSDPPVTGTTFANTTISNLVMSNISPQESAAIWICPECVGTLPTSPPGNTWDHVLITGNTITGTASGPSHGIFVQLGWGDKLQHTTIANNKISLALGSGVQFFVGGGLGPADTGSEMVLDTRVINNSVAAPDGMGFSSGSVGSLFDGVQVIGNQIGGTTDFGGIQFLNADVQLGSGQLEHGNVMKNLAILANTIEGTAHFGISIAPGQNIGATNNAISNVVISGNTILNTLTTPNSRNGIALSGGGTGATGQSLSNVLVQANTVKSLAPPGQTNFGGFGSAIAGAGISVVGGSAVTSGALPVDTGQGNSVNGIAIANNDVDTPSVGIGVTASEGSNALASSDNNVVAGAQIFCNQVDQTPTLGVLPSSGIKGVNVVAGLDDASGNQVQQVYIADNLVAGKLGDASTFPYLGTGGSGNTLTTSNTPTPAIALVANAEGEGPTIAPNTWIEIKGIDLAPKQDALNLRTWGAPDFVNNQMPVALDGVSATVNGNDAYVYYVSPSQVNVLTPPDAIPGSVNVVVTNNGISSTPFVAQAQPLSPSFFVFDGTHVAATHGNGAYIGPLTLYPGLTTPAQPGETIVIYGNGFGQTSTPVVSGSMTQSGSLSPLPVITIGGIQANVRFAGLNLTPGEFQFNVDVPANVPDGDQPVTATINGVTTQAGVVLTVGH